MRFPRSKIIVIVLMVLASSGVYGAWEIDDVENQFYPVVTIPYSGSGPVNSSTYLFQYKSAGGGNWQLYGYTLMSPTAETSAIATSSDGHLWSTTGYKDSVGGSFAVGNYWITIIQEGPDANQFFAVAGE